MPFKLHQLAFICCMAHSTGPAFAQSITGGLLNADTTLVSIPQLCNLGTLPIYINAKSDDGQIRLDLSTDGAVVDTVLLNNDGLTDKGAWQYLPSFDQKNIILLDRQIEGHPAFRICETLHLFAEEDFVAPRVDLLAFPDKNIVEDAPIGALKIFGLELGATYSEAQRAMNSYIVSGLGQSTNIEFVDGYVGQSYRGSDQVAVDMPFFYSALARKQIDNETQIFSISLIGDEKAGRVARISAEIPGVNVYAAVNEWLGPPPVVDDNGISIWPLNTEDAGLFVGDNMPDCDPSYAFSHDARSLYRNIGCGSLVAVKNNFILLLDSTAIAAAANGQIVGEPRSSQLSGSDAAGPSLSAENLDDNSKSENLPIGGSDATNQVSASANEPALQDVQVPRSDASGAYLAVDEAGLRVTVTGNCSSPSVQISVDTPGILKSLGSKIPGVAVLAAANSSRSQCDVGSSFSGGSFPVSFWYLGNEIADGIVNWGDSRTIDITLPELEYSSDDKVMQLQKALDTGWAKTDEVYSSPDPTPGVSSLVLREMTFLAEIKARVASWDCEDSSATITRGSHLERAATDASFRIACEYASAAEDALGFRPYAGSLPDVKKIGASADGAFLLRLATCYRAYEYANGYHLGGNHLVYGLVPEYNDMFNFFKSSEKSTCADYPGLDMESTMTTCDPTRATAGPYPNELLDKLEEHAVKTWCHAPARQDGKFCRAMTITGEEVGLGMSFSQGPCTVTSAGFAECSMGVKAQFSESLDYGGLTGLFADLINTVPQFTTLYAQYVDFHPELSR